MTYGSVDFYENQFADILADIDFEEPSCTKNMAKGFHKAIDSWFDYHKNQAEAYVEFRRTIKEAFING